MAIMPRTNCGYLNASQLCSTCSRLVIGGSFETARMAAKTRKAAERRMYGVLTESRDKLLSPLPAREPKMAKPSSKGAIVVQKELMPPAMFTRCEPFEGSPRAM